jgi:hypothetical protein
MKFIKGLIVLLILFVVFIPQQSYAKEFKYWVLQTMEDNPVWVWESSNGWVYAVGYATYMHDDTNKFKKAQTEATDVAINFLKSFLKVNKIKGFQNRDFDYSKDTYYVLAAAPKSENTVQNHQPQNIYLTQKFTDEEQACIRKYSNENKVFACEIGDTVYVYAVTTAVITESGQIGIDRAYTIAKNKAKHNLKQHLEENFLSIGELQNFRGILVEINQDMIRYIGGIPLDKNIGGEFWG